MRKRLAVMIVVAALIVTAVLWHGYRRPSLPSHRLTRETAKASKGQPAPSGMLTIEGIEGLVFQQRGRKIWELFADTITLDKTQTQATAQGVRKAIYYDAEGRPLFRLSAQSLRYDANTGTVTVEGDLQVRAQLMGTGKGQGSREGEWVATAERAIWREREKVLEAFRVQGQSSDTRCFFQMIRYMPSETVLEGHGRVVLLRSNLQLTCASVRANLARRYYQAQPPVRATLLVGAPSPVTFLPIAQQPPSNPPKGEKAKPRKINLATDKPVILKGDDLIAQDVIITEEGEDYTVTAQRAVYNRQTEQVQVDGSVRFEDPETVATAPKAQIDARRRIAVFFGPVEVIVKPQKEATSANKGARGNQPAPSSEQTQKERQSLRERLRRQGGRLVCDRVEYSYRERRVVATGNVQFEQPGRYKGRADKLIYLTREDILTLEGNIVVDDVRKGHRFRCPRAVINLQTDDAQFDPPVLAEFLVTEEEETPGGKATSNKEGSASSQSAPPK